MFFKDAGYICAQNEFFKNVVLVALGCLGAGAKNVVNAVRERGMRNVMDEAGHLFFERGIKFF